MLRTLKRAGAVLLSLTMCMSLLPSTAFAAEEEGTGIISEEAEMAPADEVIIETPEEVPEEIPAETVEEPAIVEEVPAEEPELYEETPEEAAEEEPEVYEETTEEAAGEEPDEEIQIDIDGEGIAVLSVDEVSEEDIAYLDDDKNDDLDDELAIDEENFPDDVFRTYVEEHFDLDGSQTLSEEEIAAAASIDMSDNIPRQEAPDPPLCRSLEGIQYFTELEYLDVYANELSGLVNLSGLTKLTHVDCSENYNYETGESITSLNLTGDTALQELYCAYNDLKGMDLSGMTALTEVNLEYNALSSLNVSGCTNLAYLICDLNDDLTSLDVSGLENLRALDCYECSLTSLNISDTPSLDTLACYTNKLTSLDLSGCPNLTWLTCENNELSQLDVSVCPGLTYLECQNNDLTEIDVSNCTNLITLKCGSQEIASLDVSNNTALATLDCSEIGLTSLDLSNNPALETLNCSYNSLPALDLSSNPVIDTSALNIGSQYTKAAAYKGSELYIDLTDLMSEEQAENVTPTTDGAERDGTKLVYQDESLEEIAYDYETGYGAMNVIVEITEVIVTELAIDEENFPDDAFRAYIAEKFDQDHSMTLSEEEILAVTKIDISDHNTRLQAPDPPLCRSLEGIQYFTELEYLDCAGNELSGELDLSGFAKLWYLDCSSQYSWLDRGKITSLNLSGDTALEELYCCRNYITELDLSEFASTLEVLNCEENNLTELDVSGCTNLLTMYCGQNSFTTLDISGLTKLNWFDCTYVYADPTYLPSPRYQLEELILGGNDSMTVLKCDSNNLTELDLSACPNLRTLTCQVNQLTELDLSGLANLQSLQCGGNEDLGSLDLSNNPEIYSLYCADIGLTELDLSSNPDITTLVCSENHLAALDLSAQDHFNTLSIEEQTVDGHAVRSGEDIYMNLTDLMSEDQAKNVTPTTKGIEREGTKLVNLDESMEEVTYDYATEFGDMDVTVTITETELAIDEVNFPDDTFRAYIEENFDPDGSYTLSEEEILAVKKIDISDHVTRRASEAPDPPLCQSLEGIQYFTELEYLDCSGNELVGELELSGFTKLWYLDCSSNSTWDDVRDPSYQGEKSITSLILSGDPALEELYCFNNRITALDLSEIASTLEVLNCEENKLTELDVSKCTNLRTLYCGANEFTTLDVSGLATLNWLSCSAESGTIGKLEELILGGNDAMTVLQCNENQLSELDLSECPNLVTLSCSTQYNIQNSANPYTQLTELDVSVLPHLQSLTCNFNYLLGTLDLSNNPELYLLACALTGLTELDLSNNPEIVNLNCAANFLTELDLSAQDHFNNLHISDQYVDVNALASDEMLVIFLEDLVSPENIEKITTDEEDPDVRRAGNYLITTDTEAGEVVYYYAVDYQSSFGPDTEYMVVHLTINGSYQYDISEGDITLSPESFTYDGTEKTPAVTVTYDGRTLKEGTDYTTAYKENTNTGIAAVTVTGTGFYKGTLSKTFLISKADQTLTADVGSAKVTVGNSMEITVGGAYGALTFESTDPSVATVDSNGKVTGVSAGKTTILISAAGDANHNAASKYIAIEVVKTGQKVTASAESSAIKVGSTTQIHADGIGKITYESSDPAIASVNSSGKVKGLSAGTVEITVTAYGDSATARSKTTVTITVIEPDPDTTTTTLNLHLRATAASKTKVAVKWNVVENADGYELYGAKCGASMKLLKTFKNGSRQTYTQTGLKKNTSYKFKVKAYKLANGKKVYLKSSNTMHATTTSRKYTNVKSVKVSQSAVTLRAGETQKIKASVKLVDPGKKLRKHENVIRYKSNKTDVAAVNSKGKITAVSRGSCTILVYAADGAYAKVKVTVK